MTSRLFADILQWRCLNKKWGVEEEDVRSQNREGGKEKAFFWWMRSSPVTFGREHSCEDLLSTRKQAVCFRQACRAPGPTSHLYSSDTWSQPDNTCGTRARSTQKWEIFSTRTKKQSPLNTTETPLGINLSCFSFSSASLCAVEER